MQYMKGGTWQLWAFLDMDNNFLKMIKKTFKNFDPFSIVKFEFFDQFW